MGPMGWKPSSDGAAFFDVLSSLNALKVPAKLSNSGSSSFFSSSCALNGRVSPMGGVVLLDLDLRLWHPETLETVKPSVRLGKVVPRARLLLELKQEQAEVQMN